MTNPDWPAWHEAYADPRSALGERLDAVRAQIGRHLDMTAPNAVRVVSACAGDGRDLLGVLANRSDAHRVDALLVEYDGGLVDRARDAAKRVTARVDARLGDAAQSNIYAGAVPADLVLLCGIFGNITDEDVRATIEAIPQLCATGAEVIWTRHRREPDLTPAVREWFSDAGFDEVTFEAPEGAQWSVGVHRLVGEPKSLVADRHWFTFVR